MASGDRIYLADKETLDSVDTKIGEINETSTTTADALDSTTSNVLKRLYYLVHRLGNYSATSSSVSSTLFGRINYIIQEIKKIGITTDTIPSNPNKTGSIMGKLNTLLERTAISYPGSSSDEQIASFSISTSQSGLYDNKVVVLGYFIAPQDGFYNIRILYDITSNATQCNGWLVDISDQTLIAAMQHSGQDTESLVTWASKARNTQHSAPKMKYGAFMDLNIGAGDTNALMYCRRGELHVVGVQGYGETASQGFNLNYIKTDVNVILED